MSKVVADVTLPVDVAFCSTFARSYVHAYRPHFKVHQLTLCRKVVFDDGFNGSPQKRIMCPTCLKIMSGKRP